MVKFTLLNIDKAKYFKYKKFYDLRGLRRNLNRDLDFTVDSKQIINPFTIIPEKVYSNFSRDLYVRNQIVFPLTIPVHYKKVYMPKDYFRSVKETPSEPNFAVFTGNQLLYSISLFRDYSLDELIQMFVQLSKKPQADQLNLQNNELLTEAVDHLVKIHTTLRIDQMCEIFHSLYRLGFKRDILEPFKKDLIYKY